MPRPRGGGRDLSKQDGNLTSAIEQNYDALKSISDPQMLTQKLTELAEKYRGTGLSDQNYRKFVMGLRNSQGDLTRLQYFMTNYLLAGSGMRVSESVVDQVANLICEGTHRLQLTKQQESVMRLVAKHGYRATLL